MRLREWEPVPHDCEHLLHELHWLTTEAFCGAVVASGGGFSVPSSFHHSTDFRPAVGAAVLLSASAVGRGVGAVVGACVGAVVGAGVGGAGVGGAGVGASVGTGVGDHVAPARSHVWQPQPGRPSGVM